MEDEELEEEETSCFVNDWMERVHELPEQPLSVAESRFERLFALDVGGQHGHDQYVYLVPNGLAIVGLAPSHALLRSSTHTSAAPDQQQQQLQIQGDNSPREGGSHVLATDDGERRTQGIHAEQGVGTEAQGEGQAITADGDGTHLQGQNTHPGQSSQQHPGQQRGAQDQPAYDDASQQQPQPQQPGNSRSISQQQQQRQHEHQNEDQHLNKRQKHAPAPKTRNPLPFTAEQLAAVNFDIGKRTAAQKQSGKKKKAQGTVLDANSVLCKLEGSNGTHVPVRAVAPGKLLEVNQRLQQTPSLVLERPLREGYIAILFPTDSQRAALVKSLLSAEQYLQSKGLTSKDLSQ